jgi:outer membrane protein assembly factor BamA
VFCQKQYTLKVIHDAPESFNFNKKIHFKKTHPNLTAAKNEALKIVNQLQASSRITSNLDSLTTDSLKNVTAYIHVGAPFKWTYLKSGNAEEEVLSSIGFREKIFLNKPFNQNQLYKFYERIIKYYENNGYPFASVQLDSIQLHSNEVAAKLNINKGPLYKIDSIIIKGNANISPHYIYNSIKLKPGDLYNESILQEIPKRLKEIPFVTEKEKMNLKFYEKQAKLYLYLKKKKASRFNGILGFLPDENTGKLQLTGELQLSLLNGFGNGELIDFHWRSLQQNTQNLNFKFNYPFIFQSSFGVDYDFKLFKKDTLFIEVKHKIGVRYILKGNNYFKVFINANTSNLLSDKGFSTLTVLPSYADVKSTLYGIEGYFNKLDYKYNPTKGFEFNIQGATGNKSIAKNPKLNPILYEGIQLNSNLYNALFDGRIFFPIVKRHVVMYRNNSAYIYNENLFENELMRIGGLKTLRGFNEESIFASLYSINTIEYRFILEQNSYLFTFFDWAYYEKNTIIDPIIDTPFGFGTGISFETKAGIFTLNYALGKQFDNPILIRNAKIHFGFVNFF